MIFSCSFFAWQSQYLIEVNSEKLVWKRKEQDRIQKKNLGNDDTLQYVLYDSINLTKQAEVSFCPLKQLPLKYDTSNFSDLTEAVHTFT